MKDQKTKEQFIELRAKGLSFEKITHEINISKQTLINWSKDLAMEISNLKAIELDALQEKYYMTKKARVELFGNQVQEIITELEKRDFSDMPTDKLFDLLFKSAKILKEESMPTAFSKEVEVSILDIDFNKSTATWQA